MMKAMLTPGERPKAQIISWPYTRLHGLRLELDGGTVVVGPDEGAGGPERLAAFLVELADEARMLAMVLDPSWAPGGHRALGEPAEGHEPRRTGHTHCAGDSGSGCG